jgi:glycosyltransferase involved in cell wall biosynthesis
MRIAYVCADRGVPIGGTKGASAHVAELVRAIADRGAEVRVLAARCADAAAGEAVGAPVEDLSAERATRQMRQALFAAARGARAQAQAAETFAVLLNQMLARALERLYRHWPFDAVYERYSLWSYAAAGFARAAGVPFLLEVNAPLREEQRTYRALENPALAATLESYLFQAASFVVVPSDELRPYVVGRGAAPGRVRVVPNAADPTRFPLRRAYRTREEFVIGFLGSLKAWHGLDDLVRAFRMLRRRHHGYRLLIAGDGPLRVSLERALRRDGLRRFATFTGAVPHDEVPALLARMDVGVAPYPRLAGFYFSPLKVFEYMAGGVPVVASDIGQLGSLLAHRHTALLHRPGAIREMAAHIDALRRSPARAAALARAGRSLVRRRFTWRHNAARVFAMIEQARAERPPTPRLARTTGERRRVS